VKVLQGREVCGLGVALAAGESGRARIAQLRVLSSLEACEPSIRLLAPRARSLALTVTASGCGNSVLISPPAQALYSLSQDNPPFRHALFNHPTALPSLVAIAREDHTAAEDSLVRKTKPTKGKEKSSDANGHADELGDGRALLVRVLVCGKSFHSG
jgi:hypothetical protein